MLKNNPIEFEYFLYPLYEKPTRDYMQTIFAHGLPIQEKTLAIRRNSSWKDETKTEEELLKERDPKIKGLVVIQIPQMFLFGLPECMSGEVELTWKGFMPYLKCDTGTGVLHIIPQLIQGMFIPGTLEYNPNPNQSIYYHGDGLLFDRSQIKQMRNLEFNQIASSAEQRLSIPYELLLALDRSRETFYRQNEFYQGLTFNPKYKYIKGKPTRPRKIQISNPD